ncbi:MAG: CDP-alcohol phosphatidyltransferase family protein [Chlamydiales bacterium]|nr:CDP-alcohol phosphatidyltransferase family protein [Chlamydiales bacterium]
MAFLFAYGSPMARLWAVLLAMFTDSIDGFVARRSKTATRFGAILDPVMDKFFVYVCLTVLLMDHHLALWQACAMLSRDVALVLFAVYLTALRKWKNYPFRSILWGKISTAVQFMTLIALVLNVSIPPMFYTIFIVMGIFALYELFTAERVVIKK